MDISPFDLSLEGPPANTEMEESEVWGHELWAFNLTLSVWFGWVASAFYAILSSSWNWGNNVYSTGHQA